MHLYYSLSACGSSQAFILIVFTLGPWVGEGGRAGLADWGAEVGEVGEGKERQARSVWLYGNTS